MGATLGTVPGAQSGTHYCLYRSEYFGQLGLVERNLTLLRTNNKDAYQPARVRAV